jgi:hypothetical protein
VIDERIPDGLVDEMAEDYGLDAGRLRAALSESLDAYDDEHDFWAWRDGEAYAHRDDVGRVLKAARRAARLWAELSPEARKQVLFFQGGDEVDPVGPRLQFAVDLLDEYRVHYAKQRGLACVKTVEAVSVVARCIVPCKSLFVPVDVVERVVIHV